MYDDERTFPERCKSNTTSNNGLIHNGDVYDVDDDDDDEYHTRKDDGNRKYIKA